jgi:TetR/AcrR family transcriptional regulator, transcriptional repressor of bet genes
MPRVVDHDERRRELGRAVCRVVAERGMDAATVREVARSSGWSTGVLSHYFDDKTALLLHALSFVGGAAARRMRRAAALEPGEALRFVVHQALPLDQERRIEWKVWLSFWGKASGDRRLAREQARLYARWRTAIEGLIARATGKRRDGAAVEEEAAALIAFIDGLGLQASLEPERLPPRRQRALADAYLRRAFGVGT